MRPARNGVMVIFYSDNIDSGRIVLDRDESGHCCKVLRHKAGDSICVIDGRGTMYECRITDDSHKETVAEIVCLHRDWGSHPYRLAMAVCPTKNMDRYEWFAEKACEIGIDEIVPVIGEHSERKTVKTERLAKLLLSASKQSLKAKVPSVGEMVSVTDFIKDSCLRRNDGIGNGGKVLKLIAYCFDDEAVPRRSMKEVLESFDGDMVVVMIGPEGDFSREEAELAVAHGFIPVHLGASRLRTETAALVATAMVYNRFL